MPFFSRSTPDAVTYSLGFAEGQKMGALQAQLDELQREVESLRARIPAEGMPQLDMKITTTMQALSHGEPALYRHLESQAKELVEAGLPVERIIEQLRRGTPVTRIREG